MKQNRVITPHTTLHGICGIRNCREASGSGNTRVWQEEGKHAYLAYTRRHRTMHNASEGHAFEVLQALGKRLRSSDFSQANPCATANRTPAPNVLDASLSSRAHDQRSRIIVCCLGRKCHPIYPTCAKTFFKLP